MSDQSTRAGERAIDVQRYGAESRRPKFPIGEDPGYEIRNIERQHENRLNRLGRGQAIELPSHRRGEWIYRATTYAVDAFDVLAYVGDATGAEAVRLSEEFLARCDDTFDPDSLNSPEIIQETP